MDNIKPVIELELYIIRHGESMGNISYNGRTDLTFTERVDPVLSEKGLKQAIAAGEFLSEINLDAVYSSALMRAVRTAGEIIKKQPEEIKLFIHPVYTEMGIPEEYHAVSMDELRKLCPTAVIADGVDPESRLMESTAGSDEKGLFERGAKAIEFLRSKYKNGEKVAVVSHAAFITYMVFYIMGYKEKIPAFDIDFNNTGITKVKFYKEGTNKYGDIVFEYINSTAHLLNI
ncbi:MAG: histidine phosphatase family protein [Clostridia bacterium]|nr:histidine phosphatase family protein [Clostridia bacterium]